MPYMRHSHFVLSGKSNREEFAKSGTMGKCIEARELIIALPEGLYHYEHDYLIKHFAMDFKKKYGVDCYAGKRYWMKVVTSVMAVRLSEKARSMRKRVLCKRRRI